MTEPSAGIARTAARGARQVLVAQGAKFAAQILGIALLSRLLAPADFGLMATVVALVGIGEIVRDFGLSSAAIQAREITRRQQSNLLWINVATGILLATALAAGSSTLARAYDAPALGTVALALAPVLLLSSVSAQYRADLTRRLNFKAIARADVWAALTALAAAVLVAYFTRSFWALVTQQLVQAAVLLIVLVGHGRWVPGRPTRGVEMGPLLRFGWNVTFTQGLNYLSRNVDTFVIGYRFGASSLGLYNRAFQLLMLPLNQINAPATTVALPILSASQDEHARFRQLMVRCQTVLLMAVFAVIAACFALAPVGVEVVLGHQWAGSVVLFRILCLAGMFQAASYVTYWAFVSLGMTGSHVRYSLCTRPVMIVLILGGSFWGAEGVAWAYGCSVAIMWPIGLWWIRKHPAVPTRELFVSCLRLLIPFAMSATAGALVVSALWKYGLVISGLSGGVALVLCWATVWLADRGFRQSLKESVTFVRQGFARGAVK